MKKTGVTPSVVTVYNEKWSNRTNLEEYAYDRYLMEFDDEMHWLIVYSQESYPSSSYIDWYWEGMQGDDTDNILTSAVVDRFTSVFQSRLTSNDKDIGAQLSALFDDITASYKKGLNLKESAPYLFPLAFVLFHMFFMVFFGTFKYRGAKPAPEEPDTFGLQTAGSSSYNGTDSGYGDTSPYLQTSKKTGMTGNAYGGGQAREVICEFCGSYYSARLKYCPHCNASNPDNLL